MQGGEPMETVEDRFLRSDFFTDQGRSGATPWGEFHQTSTGLPGLMVVESRADSGQRARETVNRHSLFRPKLTS